MPLNVRLSFPASAEASAAVAEGFVVRRFELHEAMSDIFDLTVEALSTDPALVEGAFVGQAVTVALDDEPFVRKVTGIVQAMDQHSAVNGGNSRYAWTIVPPLWLTTRRRDCRIFQHKSAPEIVDAVLADPSYAGRIPSPAKQLGGHEILAYVVQYDETDWEFISRILADAGISSWFDHTNGSRWTLTDDTPGTAPDVTGGAIPFADPSNMNTSGASLVRPHVLTARITSKVETSAVTLRDYDFEKPGFLLQAKREVVGAATFTNEAQLEAYGFGVGKFRAQAPGDVRARTLLEADRSARRRILCTASFALPPGTRFTLADHPRDDLADAFLVVRARTVVDPDERSTHELELMELARPFRPARCPKPRIYGTQTAFVVGAQGEEIDVDTYGRVEVEFRWDRRDTHSAGASRRVRVSQGWAGAGFGFVMLPRVGEEVVIAYLDGDPDQPLIVGRVHNALVTSPLSLPGQKTVSVLRTRSSPNSDGYNQILLDDAAGAERFEMHAQLDSKHVVERDASSSTGRNAARSVAVNDSGKVGGNQTSDVAGDQASSVGGNQTSTVGGDQASTVGGNQTSAVGGNRTSTVGGNETSSTGGNHTSGVGGARDINIGGATTVTGKTVKVDVGDTTIDVDGTLDVGAGSMDLHSDGTITINATTIKLVAGGSTLTMTGGKITLDSPLIELNP
jgi:type VI secretion system secreted protein VgrG